MDWVPSVSDRPPVMDATPAAGRLKVQMFPLWVKTEYASLFASVERLMPWAPSPVVSRAGGPAGSPERARSIL